LRNEKGQLKNYLYIVYEVPQTVDISHVEPKRENPVLGNPILGNPRLLSTKTLGSDKSCITKIGIRKSITKIYAL